MIGSLSGNKKVDPPHRDESNPRYHPNSERLAFRTFTALYRLRLGFLLAPLSRIFEEMLPR